MGDAADSPPGARRYTVAEAADVLGITTGAVRNRLSRGTLASVKESGTVYVLLPADTPRDTARDTADTPGDIPQPERDVLISEMRGRIDDLRDQLEAERQAHAEARRIIAGLVERIPAIEAPQEPPGGPETAESPGPRKDPSPTRRGRRRAHSPGPGGVGCSGVNGRHRAR